MKYRIYKKVLIQVVMFFALLVFLLPLVSFAQGEAVISIDAEMDKNGRKLEGTGELTLSNGDIYDVIVKGKYNSKKDRTTFKIKGVEKGIKIKLKIDEGSDTATFIKGKAFGQKLNQQTLKYEPTNDMIILNNEIEIAANPNLAEWIPRISYNSVDDEFLVVWTEQGAREEGGSNLYGIAAQRFSSLGEKIDASFGPAGNPVNKIILLPTPEYNMFSNEYLIAYTMSEVGFDQFGTMIDSTGTIINTPFPISQKDKSQMHSRVAFNTLEKQYFVVYNSSEIGSPDIRGVILDENGIPVTEELIINDTVGDQYNPYIVYNSRENTYLINWEDFRNVPNWEQNGEIYGALLDSDGSVLVNDIAMIDDFGTINEGDQRHNEIAYNEDKNEFFVCWSDMAPSLQNVGVRGRFIASDGTLAGPIFIVEDSPAPQMYPHPIYVPTKRKYFIQWEDGRNAEDPNAYWRDIYADEIDIYGKWMSSSGISFSDEIVFCDQPGIQRYSSISYADDSDRIMVAWMDSVDEDLKLGETGDQDGQHILEKGGNIYGVVYGSP